MPFCYFTGGIHFAYKNNSTYQRSYFPEIGGNIVKEYKQISDLLISR